MLLASLLFWIGQPEAEALHTTAPILLLSQQVCKTSLYLSTLLHNHLFPSCSISLRRASKSCCCYPTTRLSQAQHTWSNVWADDEQLRLQDLLPGANDGDLTTLLPCAAAPPAGQGGACSMSDLIGRTVQFYWTVEGRACGPLSLFYLKPPCCQELAEPQHPLLVFRAEWENLP